MILQLQSDSLIALLAQDGAQCRRGKAGMGPVIQTREKAKSPPPPQTVCNDRTHLNVRPKDRPQE